MSCDNEETCGHNACFAYCQEFKEVSTPDSERIADKRDYKLAYDESLKHLKRVGASLTEADTTISTLRRLGECGGCIKLKKEVAERDGLIEFHKGEHMSYLGLFHEQRGGEAFNVMQKRNVELEKDVATLRRGSALIKARARGIGAMVSLAISEAVTAQDLLAYPDATVKTIKNKLIAGLEAVFKAEEAS
jgi:hypothetical protein